MKASAGKILMLVENSYPQDPRVRNEACLLASAGYEVSVIALRRQGQLWTEVTEGVRVFRIPRLTVFKKTPNADVGWLNRLFLKAKALVGYIAEYGYFTTSCLAVSTYVLLRYGFDVIHAHNPPDTLFLVALPFKILGRKFVFDHHDLCPELYRSRYSAPPGFLTLMLTTFEWCSLRLADLTIATNESYRQTQITRGGRKPDEIFIVRNGPSDRRMTPVPPSPRLRSMGKSILCYVGSMNPQDGLDYLLRALHHLRYSLKREDFHCVIMGSGDSLEDLRALASKLQLNGHVDFTGFVSDEDLRANLAAADICVDPDPSSPLNDVSTWIKIMEYMANSKPIVTFDLKETHFSAQDAALYVPPNDEVKFAGALAKLMDDPQAREEMGKLGRTRVEQQLQWSIVGRKLLEAYESLLA